MIVIFPSASKLPNEFPKLIWSADSFSVFKNHLKTILFFKVLTHLICSFFISWSFSRSFSKKKECILGTSCTCKCQVEHGMYRHLFLKAGERGCGPGEAWAGSWATGAGAWAAHTQRQMIVTTSVWFIWESAEYIQRKHSARYSARSRLGRWIMRVRQWTSGPWNTQIQDILG